MSSQKSAVRGVVSTLQAVLSVSGNGTVLAIPNSFSYHKFIIKGSAGVGAGAVQVEQADDPAYAGAWAQVGGGPVAVVASTELVVTYTGVIRFVRARISTPLVGGTVSVTYEGS